MRTEDDIKLQNKYVHLGDIPIATESENRKLSKSMGLSGMPIYESTKDIGNAYYIPSSNAYDAIAEYVKGSDKAKASAKELERLNQVGGIVYDSDLNRSAIVAHELGHATIANEPQPSLSKTISMLGRGTILGGAVGVTGTVAAGIAGAYLGKLIGSSANGGKGSMDTGRVGSAIGAGLGAAAGSLLLMEAPVLLNEYEATDRANIHLDKLRGKNSPIREKERRVLKDAYKTYIKSAIINTAMVGLGGSMVAGIAGSVK